MSQAGSLSSEAVLPPDVPLTFTGNTGSGAAVANNFDIVGTGAITTSVVGDTLTISTSASGTVTSVSGTANRITSTGGNTPVLDISASYVGQSSITTLGTIGTGTWNGSKISEAYGGTNQTTYATGDILYASGVNTLSKLPAGSNTQILTLAGGVPTWAAPATSGTVTSVSGTLNRITSTGGNTPVIDISASYVGQSSITTLGTIGTGTWNGTVIGPTFGGTNQSTYATGDILYASGVNTLSKLPAGSNTQILTLAGGVPTWAAPATSGTVTSVSGTTNRITSTGGNTPVIDISASYVGQSSITTLGTITTGVWNGTDIDLASGGTNATLTASNGGIFYSTSTAGAILSGTAKAGQHLQSGASSAPSWTTATFPSTATSTGTILRADGTNWVATTATYPATTTINQILFSSAANTISGITTANNGILTTGTTGVPGVLAAGTSGAILRSGAPAAWSTTTYPATNAINTILYASAANVMSALATANNGVLLTNASGVPSITTAGTATTPTCVGGTTPGTTSYTTQAARSIRIGPVVIYEFNVQGSYGGTAAGAVNISIPTTAVSTANINNYGTGVAVSGGSTQAMGCFQIAPSGTVMTFLTSAGATLNVTAGGSFNFQGTITYFVA